MDFNRPPGDGSSHNHHCGCDQNHAGPKRRRIDEPDGDGDGENVANCSGACSRRLIVDESSNDDMSSEAEEEAQAAAHANLQLQPLAIANHGEFIPRRPLFHLFINDGLNSFSEGQNTEQVRANENEGSRRSTETPGTSGAQVTAPLPIPLESPRTPGPSSSNSLARIDELGWQESRPALTQRAGYLLNNSRMSDVRFLVGETKVEIFGHKTLLALGSPVFEAQFFGSVGSGAATDAIELPDMEPDTFLMFLKYLYTDELENSLDDTQLLCLLRPAKKYIVPHLVDKCSDILMTELKPENIFQILHHAQFYQLKKLEGACERYIDRNSEAIVGSEEFTNLGKSILTDFLKRDGLNINEETLFQAVLRWATAECQRNSVETTFENLRLALGDCLKLIRFPTMSREEFASVFETTNILSPEEACSVFVYMCKSSSPDPLTSNTVFPTLKRTFAPQLCVVTRFGGDALEHSLNYRSGEIYNYRINFKVDRTIFLKGVNIFSIRCGFGGPQQTVGYHGSNRRDFNGALYLYEKGAPSYQGRKQFSKAGSLEPDESAVPLTGGRRQYYPVLFDAEIAIGPGKTYTICVVVSVNSHSYPTQPLQTYMGTNERGKCSVLHSEDLSINFCFLGSSVDGSVGRFTSAQIPELIFCL